MLFFRSSLSLSLSDGESTRSTTYVCDVHQIKVETTVTDLGIIAYRVDDDLDLVRTGHIDRESNDPQDDAGVRVGRMCRSSDGAACPVDLTTPSQQLLLTSAAAVLGD
jgi:hypothetical protein